MDTVRTHGQARQAETFDTVNPATSEVIATFPDPRPGPRSTRAVERAREAAAWWSELGWKERQTRLLAWKSSPDPLHRPPGRARPQRDRQAAGRRPAGDLPGGRAHRLGGAQRPPGCSARAGAQRDPGDQPRVVGRVRLARRHRRDRAVELPGLHADGLDRLRAGRGQRASCSSPASFTPATGGWLVSSFAEVVPEHPVPAAGHRGRRDRRGAGPQRREQDLVHRLHARPRAR